MHRSGPEATPENALKAFSDVGDESGASGIVLDGVVSYSTRALLVDIRDPQGPWQVDPSPELSNVSSAPLRPSVNVCDGLYLSGSSVFSSGPRFPQPNGRLPAVVSHHKEGPSAASCTVQQKRRTREREDARLDCDDAKDPRAGRSCPDRPCCPAIPQSQEAWLNFVKINVTASLFRGPDGPAHMCCPVGDRAAVRTKPMPQVVSGAHTDSLLRGVANGDA
ncbi:hypothetical protein CKAH01_05987 [Colletotrichum kahawae]|uniref:Uncharacterized protein n=1 Tax=Colletotrichum kahawae TaxID=34407 RepID=A0AAD9YDQ0_COLKA|nr:hypothetical protein CKAH01_05987 [Colletotrichum kahawae]